VGEDFLADVMVPLVIGITGHRQIDPRDHAGLYGAIAAILNRVRHNYGGRARLVLLSPLAEGADRIAAMAALDSGFHLQVPLPMPRREYERDFPGSRDDFEALLLRADNWFELPYVEGNSDENVLNPVNRDRQYLAVGQYIARHCQFLIALWNGEECEEEDGCGTAAIVRYKLEGVGRTVRCAGEDDSGLACPPRNLLERTECGLVHHIWTRRQGENAPPGGQLFTERTLFPNSFAGLSGAKTYYSRICANIAEFNRDLEEGGDELQSASERSRDDLVPSRVQEQLSQEERVTLARYACADALAGKFQALTQRTTVRIHLLVGAGSILFGFYAHLIYELNPLRKPEQLLPTTIIVGALGLYLVAAWLKHFRADRLDYQNKHQDYRALAEGLRVQFFWDLAGIRESVVDYYLGKHRTELDWIRNALRNWRTTSSGAGARRPQDSIPVILEYWIKAQERYFNRHTDRQRRKALEGRVGKLLWLSLAVSGVLVLVTVLNYSREELVRGVLAVIIGVLLLVAGLTHHYTEQMAFKEHEREHARLAAAFASAAALLEKALGRGDWIRVLMLLRDSGIVALEENANWVLLHRERPLEIPAAA